MNKHQSLEQNNQEQWEQLLFVLQERDKPTIIVISFDSCQTQKKIYEKLKKNLTLYKFYNVDLAAKSILSLHRTFLNTLPEVVLNSKPVEYIVNVFRLEDSFFTIQSGKFEDSSLIHEMNFERDNLFRDFPFITIFWADIYTVNMLRQKAKDLWDWINYHFEFRSKNEKGGDETLPSYKYDIKVFISYAKEDIAIAEKLYNDLVVAGVNPWIDSKNILPGQNWRLHIQQALKSADYILVLLSSRSISNRGYIQKELKSVFDLLDASPSSDIFMIPVKIDECQIVDSQLQDLHWVDLSVDYETGLKQILRVLVPGQTEKAIIIPPLKNFIEQYIKQQLTEYQIQSSLEQIPSLPSRKLLQTVVQKLSKGEIQSALEELHSYFGTNTISSPHNEVVLYLARYKRLVVEKNKGIITYELLQLEISQLINNILRLIMELSNTLQKKVIKADSFISPMNEMTLRTERIKRIKALKARYDSIQLDDSSKERVIKEKITLQKLLGEEYMELGHYEKAKWFFYNALSLAQQIEGFGYERDEIYFLLNQIDYQPT